MEGTVACMRPTPQCILRGLGDERETCYVSRFSLISLSGNHGCSSAQKARKSGVKRRVEDISVLSGE